MAYDERLADRIRELIGAVDGVEERRMFGGLCFLVHGNMCCGVLGDRLVLRLGEAAARRALEQDHTAVMDFTGRPSRTMIYVSAPGFATESDLSRWIERALSYAGGLPPKEGGRRR